MKGNPTWGHVLRKDPILLVLREEIASLLIFIKNKVEMICQFALDYGYQYIYISKKLWALFDIQRAVLNSALSHTDPH